MLPSTVIEVTLSNRPKPIVCVHSRRLFSAASQRSVLFIVCGRGEGVHGVLTLFGRGKAQVCHDLRVVELREQLEVEEEDGGQTGGRGRRKERSRIKEMRP